MGIKRPKPEEIVTRLRQVEVLTGQGMARIDAIWQVSIAEETYYRWRKHYGGMGKDQLKELKLLSPARRRQCIDRVDGKLKVSESYLLDTGPTSIDPAIRPKGPGR